MKRLSAFLAALLALWALPRSASAEIAVLGNGMTLKVVARRVEEGTVMLSLKGGGEIGVPEANVRGFVPDEVMDEVDPPPAGGGSDIRALAVQAAERHGVDPALVLAVIGVESAFRPDAVSPKGAKGLMQLMPKTAASLGVADPFDPAANLDGGARHLEGLVSRYKGDLKKALAAYNSGEAAVDAHGGVPPYAETVAYVSKVLEKLRTPQ